jgi:hypothetical protein
MVRRSLVEFVEVYIFIYNGLNEGSFNQVGACLQSWVLYEDWIPQILVGSKINKSGLVMRIGFLIYYLDLRTTS